MPTETPPKKQISARRRQQNKEAQKTYRERQKRNLERLQNIAASKIGFFGLEPGESGVLQAEPDKSTSTKQLSAVYDVALMQLSPSVSSNDESTQLSDVRFFGWNMQLKSGPVTNLSPNQNPGFTATSDHLPQRHLETGISLYTAQINPYSTARAEQLAIPSPPESIQNFSNIGDLVQPNNGTLITILGNVYTLEEIMKAGLKTLSQEAPSQETSAFVEDTKSHHPALRTDKILVFQNAKSDPTSMLPDIRRNHFRIKQVLWVAACVANAAHLGLTLEDSNCEDALSPFFQDPVSEEVARTACQTSFKDLKEHLRPLPIQLMHQHHPYIDVLPFPTFRERLIKLAYGDTPMIDEDDLCNDLENDGLICWGSSLGAGSVATGSGAPWDIRSWEAQPWFLKKWWILIGGAEGELYKQTQWWCEIRGEKSCYP